MNSYGILEGIGDLREFVLERRVNRKMKDGRIGRPLYRIVTGDGEALLSYAELDILLLLATGTCTRSGLAHARGRAEDTVANQLSSIFEKLNVGNCAEAISMIWSDIARWAVAKAREARDFVDSNGELRRSQAENERLRQPVVGPRYP